MAWAVTVCRDSDADRCCEQYVFDCHWVTLYVEHNVTHGAKPYIAAEGRVNQNRQEQDVGGVMQAPYR